MRATKLLLATIILFSFFDLMISKKCQAQQFILGVDSSANAAHLFNPFDGSLVQSNFLDWNALGTGGSTAKHALQVADQIWVSDQIRDVIYRFNLAGNHLGTIGNTGLDNIKGMEVVGDQVWVTNAGTNNGAPGNSIVFVDIATQNIVGSVATTGSLFDLVNYQGLILGSNITGEDLEFYNLDGTFHSTFHDSDGVTGIDFPQQIFVRQNGNLFVSGFSAPAGVYEFDSNGNDLGIVAASGLGPRGVIELGNGEIMWTNGSGFFVGADNVYGGSGQYLTLFNAIPEPGSGVVCFAFLALFGLTRRRR